MMLKRIQEGHPAVDGPPVAFASFSIDLSLDIVNSFYMALGICLLYKVGKETLKCPNIYRLE